MRRFNIIWKCGDADNFPTLAKTNSYANGPNKISLKYLGMYP